MRKRTIALILALTIAWTCLSQTASASILPGLPSDKNCGAACDCAKCCADNFSAFYLYSIAGTTAKDWRAWFNAGQPKGIGCDEIALVAWFATTVICVLGGEDVTPCLALAWMLYYIDLVLCYNTCKEGICN